MIEEDLNWTFVMIRRSKTDEKTGGEAGKKTRNLSRMPPWLLSTLLIVSGSVEDATFFSPLLSIWCHRKWNFISYSAAIALDRAHQDKADSYLQICLSCGTINHHTNIADLFFSTPVVRKSLYIKLTFTRLPRFMICYASSRLFSSVAVLWYRLWEPETD